MKKIKFKTIKSAFSLLEALMTILILGLVFIASAPILADNVKKEQVANNDLKAMQQSIKTLQRVVTANRSAIMGDIDQLKKIKSDFTEDSTAVDTRITTNKNWSADNRSAIMGDSPQLKKIKSDFTEDSTAVDTQITTNKDNLDSTIGFVGSNRKAILGSGDKLSEINTSTFSETGSDDKTQIKENEEAIAGIGTSGGSEASGGCGNCDNLKNDLDSLKDEFNELKKEWDDFKEELEEYKDDSASGVSRTDRWY